MASSGSQWFANAGGGGGGYAIGNSAVFTSGNSEFFRGAPGAGNQKTWTISLWFKRGKQGTVQHLIRRDGADYAYVRINADDTMTHYNEKITVTANNLITNNVFRDSTAWYHLVIASDQTQATSTERIKIFINGAQASMATNTIGLGQNVEGVFFDSTAIEIGNGVDANYWDGYISEVVHIDGTALAPTSFGEYDSNGVWKPVDVSGLTFGTKGWYLPFSNADPFGTFGESNNGTLSINSINPNSIGYTFTAPSTTTLTAIQFQGVSGTTGNVDAYIYTNNSGSPGSVAKSLGTFATASAVFSITADFSMTAGTVYWIVLIPNGTIDQQLRTVSVSTANPIAAGRTNNGGAPTTITAGLNMSSRNWRVNLLTSAGGLGTDASGNGFNFTNNNSVSQSTDSPTQNHCTFNPLSPTGAVLSSGNLVTVLTGNGGYDSIGGTQSFPRSGKWYFEITFTTANSVNSNLIGIAGGSSIKTDTSGIDSGTNYRTYRSDAGQKQSDLASAATYGDAYGAGDVIGVAVDMDNGALYFRNQGTFQNSGNPESGASKTGAAFTDLITAAVYTSGGLEWTPFVHNDGTSDNTFTANFGQSDFAATIPNGYSTLMTANYPTPSVPDGSAHHQAILWSGNSSSQTVSQTGNSGFTPDWAIIKSRSFANGANSFDVVRGSTKGLATFDTGAEDTNSDGVAFGIGSGKGTLGFTGAGNTGDINNSGRTYVGLTWKAGGSASTNEVGSIDSSVSVNTTAGISVGTYSGSSSNATIGHGLGLVPRMIWVKKRQAANWSVYSAVAGNTHYQYLDTEAARVDDSSYWQDTDPTTTVFSIGTSSDVQGSGKTFVFYAMADVAGYQKIGAYTGNGSADGPMIHTGFKPQYVMIKSTTQGSTNWEFFCDEIEPNNVVGDQNFFNIANAEADNDHKMDWLATGFKIRDSSGSINTGSGTFLYWAIAKYPFGGTCPAPAR